MTKAKKKAKSQGQRNKKLREENGKTGIVEVCTWVPKDRRPELLALSALWRRQHLKELNAGGEHE